MKFNTITIIGIVASLIIGYFLNDYANKKNNERLIAAFKAELDLLNQAKTRISNSTELISINQQEQILNAQINLLESL